MKSFTQLFRRKDWRTECTAALIAQAQAEAKLAVLESLVAELRTERNGLQDRLLNIFNLRGIHTPQTAAAAADNEAIKPTNTVRDYVAVAQRLEDQAFAEERKQEREDIFKKIQEGKK